MSSEILSSTVTALVYCLERPRIWRGTRDYLILLSPFRVYVSPAAATSRTTCRSFVWSIGTKLKDQAWRAGRR
jgi:hypothetical protein